MKINKKLIILSIIMIVACLFIATISNAADEKTGEVTLSNGQTVGFTYKLNSNNQAIELKCINPEKITGEFTVPAKIDGHDVVNVGDKAFANATNVTKITIPNTVKEIEYKAFANCIKLKNVNLGSIESISFKAFDGCTSLTEITIPNNTKRIYYSAFSNCSQLKKITILGNPEINDPFGGRFFSGHNQDLTIYCYKDTEIAQYAIKYNIKHEFLTKEEQKTETTKNNEEIKLTDNTSKTQTTNNNNINNTKVEDNTVAKDILPKAGAGKISIFVLIIAISGIYGFKKYNNLKDVK